VIGAVDNSPRIEIDDTGRRTEIWPNHLSNEDFDGRRFLGYAKIVKAVGCFRGLRRVVYESSMFRRVHIEVIYFNHDRVVMTSQVLFGAECFRGKVK